MHSPLLLTLVSLGATSLVVSASLVGLAFLAKWTGVCVKQVSVGRPLFGPPVLAWKGRHWNWEIGMFPLWGTVILDTDYEDRTDSTDTEKDRSDESIEPIASASIDREGGGAKDIPRSGTIDAAPMVVRFGLWFAIPFAKCVLATILLSVATFGNSGQLLYFPDGNVGPAWGGIPGLLVANQPTTF